MSETPAVEDLERERLDAIVPFVEQDDERPDFLEDDPEDHEWVKALVADREARTLHHENGDEYCQDPSIMQLANNEVAYLLGYDQAIHKLRELASGQGIEVRVVSIEGHERVEPVDGD